MNWQAERAKFSSAGDKMLAHSRWEGSCLLWMGGREHGGYGRFEFNGQNYRVHRLGLTLKLGRPIKKGMLACHAVECPNTNCWAPDHLYEGTPQTNRDDDQVTGRIKRGRQLPQTILTEDDIRAIRADRRLGRVVAFAYGITEGHVSEIRHRKKWAHLN